MVKVSILRSIVHLARPKHWIKNLLVLIPIVFSGHIFDQPYALIGLIGWLAFSLLASSVYCLNDLCDAPNDKKHPTKRERPIAKGEISPMVARLMIAILLSLSIILTCLVANDLIVSLCFATAYFGTNVAYSFGLRNIPIVDVFIVALGFMLRVAYGGAIANIYISSWMFLTILSLSLFFAFGKRRGEYSKVGTKSRASLQGYTFEFLDKAMYVFLCCGMVFYALWVFAYTDSPSPLLVSCIPISMFICMQYCFALEGGSSDGDPVDTVFADKWIIVSTLAWCVLTVCGLYIP